ncbi:hydroxymethylpyrimidine/phosphomethylpyrimidine kinase [Rhizobium skierniewicense]|uniref:hydroxymethylpyrimidine kinase n=1 Tax=Rhizobium skierniewicense TaxID=984260 RepID=A0A7W6C7M1_9HYPH|nr:bifunctional hydroxymethylpyrimidine kinase/phosphomethylpyrimidine kinase [Rhizobium skierniewicense]MBB3945463.1 hydroxymethylpyrimidine/phosphomethylpyrimidine kinase [Rhizobium skierniewicense]NTF34017.1 bifunctional hydroxymethylpyrimidine kinase/phosphomethylpyrimidine kinase [Rhizobium skierniewicense]
MTAIALTIAGSDSSGGAGIQADLKTFSALGVFGATVITAITAQNTRGVTAVEDISANMIAAQMDAVFSDLDIGAVKIGMVSRIETIETIAAGLRHAGKRVILDPVMVATSGDRLLQEDAVESLRNRLLPLALLATPNLPEAALLSDQPVATNKQDVIRQAEAILKTGVGAVLIKGGHGTGSESVDLLLDGDDVLEFSMPRIDTTNDHGTGCTLASAITANLALGYPLADAIGLAKDYLQGALAAGRNLHIGHGHGPVHHFYRWWSA